MISKEDIYLLGDKICEIASYVLPGMICMDFIFGIGLFSNTTFTVYSFILYIIWNIFISIFIKITIPECYSEAYRHTISIVKKETGIKAKNEITEQDALHDLSETLEFIYSCVCAMFIVFFSNLFKVKYFNGYICFLISFGTATVLVNILGRIISIPLKFFFKKNTIKYLSMR